MIKSNARASDQARRLSALLASDLRSTVSEFVDRWNREPVVPYDDLPRDAVTAQFGPFEDGGDSVHLQLLADGSAGLAAPSTSPDVRILGDPLDAGRLLTNDLHPMIAFYRGGFRMHPEQATLASAPDRWQKILRVFEDIADG